MKTRIVEFGEYNINILEVIKESPYGTEYEYYIKDSAYSDFRFVFGVQRRFYKKDLRNLILNDYFGVRDNNALLESFYGFMDKSVNDFWEDISGELK